MTVKLLTEHHLEFLSLKGGCRGSSKFTLVKMSKCWKSHATAHTLHGIVGNQSSVMNCLVKEYLCNFEIELCIV